MSNATAEAEADQNIQSHNIDDFLSFLNQLNIEAFLSFHSLTTTFEYLITHMVKTFLLESNQIFMC